MRVDLTEVSPHDLDTPPLLEKGRYTFDIVSVEPTFEDKSPHVRVRCKVVAGPSYVGSPHTERFYLSKGAMPRFAAFLKRMGLVGDADFGVAFEIDETLLIGQRVIADVVQEAYKSDKGVEGVSSKWGYMSFWKAGDEPGTPGRDAKGKRVKQQTPSPAAPPAPAIGSADDAQELF